MFALGVANTGIKLIKELESSMSSIEALGCGTSYCAPPKKLFLIAPGCAGFAKVLRAPVRARFRA
jgi:hypothetical protein